MLPHERLAAYCEEPLCCVFYGSHSPMLPRHSTTQRRRTGDQVSHGRTGSIPARFFPESVMVRLSPSPAVPKMWRSGSTHSCVEPPTSLPTHRLRHRCKPAEDYNLFRSRPQRFQGRCFSKRTRNRGTRIRRAGMRFPFFYTRNSRRNLCRSASPMFTKSVLRHTTQE